jgi:NDP-sugar pyrophosphorylase family protein
VPQYPPQLPQTWQTRMWNFFFRSDLYFDFHDTHGPVRARARSLNPDGSRRGWIAATAEVADTAFVGRDAVVCQRARLTRFARAEDQAFLSGHCFVEDQAIVRKNARVVECSHVGGQAQVNEGSVVRGFATVDGSVKLSDSLLGDNARVGGESDLYKTTLTGNCVFRGRTISRNVRAEGTVVADGDNRIEGSDLDGAIEVRNAHLQHVLARRKARIVNAQLMGRSHVDNIEIGGGVEIADLRFEGTMRAYDHQSLQLYLENSPTRKTFTPAAEWMAL